MKPQIQFDSYIRFAVTLHIKRPCDLFILRVIINWIFVDKNILVVVIERRSIHHLPFLIQMKRKNKISISLSFLHLFRRKNTS